MKQRILAILLSLTMMFTLVPTAMAEGETAEAPAVTKVAKVGDVEYATLAEAVGAAKDGETVTLLKDAELTETLDINKAITLDGANHKITGVFSTEESLIKVQMNCTPFVRQYDILSKKWGVLLCQKEYQTNDIRRSSREWL